MTAAPRRIQRKRTRGWKMPPNTVYVGRQTMWGNPYQAGMCDLHVRGVNRVMVGNDELARAYRGYARRCLEHDPNRFEPLRGKNLACWCRLCPAHADGKPVGIVCDDCAHCHADVLLELANVAGNESAPLMPAGRSL